MGDHVTDAAVSLAHQLVANRFPVARAAWLGGSFAAGTATPTSDLDITVLLDGAPAPYRSSELIDDRPVEWFVQTEDSLLSFCEDDWVRRRRPTTMRLVGSAIILVDRDGSGLRLQRRLHQMDQFGPPSMTADDAEAKRYAVTDLLGDLEGAGDSDEAPVVAAALLHEAGDLLLATHRRWGGSGKWLLREIETLDDELGTDYATRLVRGVQSVSTGDSVPLRDVVLDILGLAGGALFDGFHRSGAAQLQIRTADVDEDGVAELLAVAAGGGPQRHLKTLTRYRTDSAATLLAGSIGSELVGVLGFTIGETAATIRHLATGRRRRRRGVATALLTELRRLVPDGLPIVAETDRDGIAFYSANGFTVTSLGEKYPGVERFTVRS